MKQIQSHLPFFPRICVLAVLSLLVVLGGCAVMKQGNDVRYVYRIEDEGDAISILVNDRNEDQVIQLVTHKYYDTSSIMDCQNLTMAEAQVQIEALHYDKQHQVESWGMDAKICQDCDFRDHGEAGFFASVNLTSVQQDLSIDPHQGFWETVHLNFSKAKFSMKNEVIQEIMEAYGLMDAYVPQGKYVSHQAMLSMPEYPFHSFMQASAIYKKTADGMVGQVREVLPQLVVPRNLPHNDFMDISYFANNFEGEEFRTATGFDNVVVPWNYCIEGTYQEQLTGYWSACTKVSLRVYDMFGDYRQFLPSNETMKYMVSAGYNLASGSISAIQFTSLFAQASKAIEIPTPFELNTFHIGNGFPTITVYETKVDGRKWSYSFTKVDDSGVYLKINSADENEVKTDHSFTFFDSQGFDTMYQELLNDGISLSGR